MEIPSNFQEALFPEGYRDREIQTSKLLLVEGKDDKAFFECLLRIINCKEVQVFPLDGKGGFVEKVQTVFGLTGFSNVEMLGIIRDSDSDPRAEFTSIQNSLRIQGQPAPQNCGQISDGRHNIKKIGIYLIPACDKNGMLEDLIFQIAKNRILKLGVMFFFWYLKILKIFSRDIYPSQIKYAKARLQVYLAGLSDCQAAFRYSNKTEKFIDYSDPKLKHVKTFLLELFD